MARSKAFEQAHREYVSATMAATIAGVNPWDSPYALWQRIRGEAPPREETFPMWLGTQMEGIVIRAFTRETKLKVRRPRKSFDLDFWYTTEEYGYPMACLLDGRTVDSTGDAVVEAKTASAYASAEWEDELPLLYFFQAQHQLAVTGWQHCYVPAIVGNKFLWRLVIRDDEVIALLTDKERAFWHQNVLAGVAPPIDGHEATSAAIKYRNQRVEPGFSVIIEDSEVERLLAVYRADGEAIDKVKEEREAIGNQLREIVGPAESAIVGAYKLTCKEQTKTLIDLKRLKEEEPEVAKRFSYTTEPTRVLRVTKRKEA